jgi:hypothetical protein
MCAAILTLEAVVLFLSGLVMTGLTDIGFGTAVAIGLSLGALCLLAAGMLRGPWGFRLGWLVQVVALTLGFVVTMMFFLGAVFAGLWAGAYLLGAKVDREKAERAELEQEWQAENGPAAGPAAGPTVG